MFLHSAQYIALELCSWDDSSTWIVKTVSPSDWIFSHALSLWSHDSVHPIFSITQKPPDQIVQIISLHAFAHRSSKHLYDFVFERASWENIKSAAAACYDSYMSISSVCADCWCCFSGPRNDVDHAITVWSSPMPSSPLRCQHRTQKVSLTISIGY